MFTDGYNRKWHLSMKKNTKTSTPICYLPMNGSNYVNKNNFYMFYTKPTFWTYHVFYNFKIMYSIDKNKLGLRYHLRKVKRLSDAIVYITSNIFPT